MNERGFTLVEVLVAMLILVVGLLGALKLVDTANETTKRNRAREGATNLAREIMETARAVDYADLEDASVTSTLQSQGGLADAAPGGAWTISRRGVVYTVTASACAYDDAKDGVSAALRTGTNYCATSATATAPGVTRTENNPDDFRRVDVEIAWSSPRPGVMNQSALVTNPTGGFGPRTNPFTHSDGSIERTVLTGTSTTFRATSSAAASLHWEASDGVSSGDAASSDGGLNWTFSWDLKNANAADAVLDGSYQISAQAFDSVGIPGNERVVSMVLDRKAPSAASGMAAGRNDRLTNIVELQWLPLRERDIVRYQVGREPASGGPETTVCDVPADTTSCYDASPAGSAVTYHVHGIDAGRYGVGADSALAPVGITTTARPAFGVGALVSLGADGVLRWPTASDSDGAIRFYRIYQNGTAYTGRIGRTATSSPTYTVPGTLSGTYYVTAVDDSFNESLPLGPVSAP